MTCHINLSSFLIFRPAVCVFGIYFHLAQGPRKCRGQTNGQTGMDKHSGNIWSSDSLVVFELRRSLFHNYALVNVLALLTYQAQA